MNLNNSALLVIDMQYDFMEGGSLEVNEANEIIRPINELLELGWGLVVASQDWHPENHVSFASNHKSKKVFEKITLADGTSQVLWPDHCKQNSKGAAIHQLINSSKIEEFVFKGKNSRVDSYSAFFDNNKVEKTNLDDLLKSKKITDIYLVGLAADFCVKFTALDGKQLGYETYFVTDATKAVQPELQNSLYETLMQNQIKLITSAEILSNF